MVLTLAGCGHWIRLEMISPTVLLTLVGEGSLLVSFVLGVCALLPVENGTCGCLMTLVQLAYRMWRCSSFMSVGLGSGQSWSQLFPSLEGVGVQVRCRLFRFVRASIFGVSVGSLDLCCELLCQLLGGLGRFIPCRIGANRCRLRGLEWAVWSNTTNHQ